MFRKTIFLMDEAKLTSNKHIYQPISVNEKASSWAHNSQLSIIWEMSLSRQLIMSGNKSVAHSWPFASWGDNSLSKFMMSGDTFSSPKTTQNLNTVLWRINVMTLSHCQLPNNMSNCDNLVWKHFSTWPFGIQGCSTMKKFCWTT